ncbi:MAG: DUF120 domain-containing protein [Pseudomonadota bacterium]|nr:DUF120 domain-containing protein [Pseudomonadota bacterium]
MMGDVLSGRVASGVGQGVFFTGLGWAREQFVAKLGIEPFPGTFNMVIDDPDAMTSWVRLKRTAGVVIENPGDGPHDCDGICWKVTLADRIEAAIVLPDVPDYPPAQIELIASVGVRDVLGVEDGDPISLQVTDGG